MERPWNARTERRSRAETGKVKVPSRGVVSSPGLAHEISLRLGLSQPHGRSRSNQGAGLRDELLC